MFSTGTSKNSFLTILFSAVLIAAPIGCSTTETSNLKLVQEVPPKRGQLKRPETMDITKPPNIGALARGEIRPPTVDEANKELEKQGGNWLYGKGFGATTLNVATCIVFPPYILYLLGNAGLEMAGYEPLYVTDAIPEPAKQGVDQVYSGVVSVPGRIAAETAGEEFRDK